MLWQEWVTTREVRAVGRVARARGRSTGGLGARVKGRSNVIVRPEMMVGSGEVSRSARCSVDRARGRSIVIGGIREGGQQ